MNTTQAQYKLNNIPASVSDNNWPQDINSFTPLMRQFLEIKYSYDLDIVLLFRVGDFYETFFEDAKLLSKELELTLTGRSEAGYPEGKIPMAGVPAKAVVNYVSRLLDKGFKVAICEQTEDPALAKGVVKRQVTKLLTPGTLIETDWLPQTKNNYLSAIYEDKKKKKYGFAYADVSCGEFYFTELNKDELLSELARLNPSEIVVPFAYELSSNKITKEKKLDLDPEISLSYFCTSFEKDYFKLDIAKKRIISELNINSIDSLGGSEYELGLIACGAVLFYVDKTQLSEKPAFEKIVPYTINNFLLMDKVTRKNLELTESLKEKSKDGSLFSVIDYSKTQMGKRKLRAWIEQPLTHLKLINERLSCVEELIKNKNIFYELGNLLEGVSDLERISSRLSAGAVNARELVALKRSLEKIPNIVIILKDLKLDFFREFTKLPKEILYVAELIQNAIVDEPPMTITDGNIIRPSYNDEVKNLKEILENGESWLKSYEEIERSRSGIKNLKVGFNRSFGYFIEISKGNLSNVPEDYICKQTMVNGSRFITSDLKDFEKKALHAESSIKTLEYEIFSSVRDEIKKHVSVLREVAFKISTLDVYFSLAQAAVINNFTKPILDNSSVIELKASRHPVVERKVGFNNFVSNDIFLEAGLSKNQLVILTGPNMAGKSTYMRQVALNVILAQIGSYIPCEYGKIGIVDQIFTRVGASDDISQGQSTFMVEMVETSAILNKMTEKSLILLDEVGRGTSTYDGVAIAWALAEYLVKNKNPRTIFATHFHELNELSDFYESICNYQVTVKEEEGHVIFLRKVIPGGADKSYGIEVARMAGLPKELLTRAKKIMETMHSKSKTPVKKQTIKTHIDNGQLSLFG